MLCSKCQFENKETAKFCKNCGNPLTVETISEPKETKRSNIFVIIVVCIIVGGAIIFFSLNKNDNNLSDPNNTAKKYEEKITIINSLEERQKYEIDYSNLPNNSIVDFFDEYHVVNRIMAPVLPEVQFMKEETESQTIYRKKITDEIDFVTIVYKLDFPVTARSYLMDSEGNVILEAEYYYVLDQSSNDYDLAYATDDTDYNYIYSDSIKKENNNMEYYYLINNGNFTIDYYQKGKFLYSLGFIKDGNKMKERIQYYNDSKIIYFEYEHFDDGTNIVYRLDENYKFQFARNYGNFTLDSQENVYNFYDNNSLISHSYNVSNNLRKNYIYDFTDLAIYEVNYSSDWVFQNIEGYIMELKPFNPFYYEKYAELFGIYDVGVYFNSFQIFK